MTEVISVRFKDKGKTYYFDSNGVEAKPGDLLVVETAKGLELANCTQESHSVDDERIVPPLRPVIRVATADDMRVAELNKAREKEAFGICEERIAKHGLDMKLVDVECNFEGSKIVFFFTSDGRVDFRELVKDLASVFRTRIELRQIGVRDEARMLGGLGICGRPFCCKQFLDEFAPVSTKMAKTQFMSLNPSKISGSCGRLMCCLRYEQETYEELLKSSPKAGAFVETEDGYGIVAQISLLRQTVKVKLDGPGDDNVKSYAIEDIAVVPGGRPKPGEEPPKVLQVKPKAKKEEPEEDMWARPNMFAYMADEPRQTAGQTESAPQEEKKNPPRRRRKNKSKSQGETRQGEQKQPEQSKQASGGNKPEQKKQDNRRQEPRRQDNRRAEQKKQESRHQDGKKPENAQPKKPENRQQRQDQPRKPQDKAKRPENAQPKKPETEGVKDQGQSQAQSKPQQKRSGGYNRHRYGNRPRNKPQDGGSKSEG